MTSAVRCNKSFNGFPGRQGQDSAIDPWGEEGEEEDTENGSLADRSEQPCRLQSLPPLFCLLVNGCIHRFIMQLQFLHYRSLMSYLCVMIKMVNVSCVSQEWMKDYIYKR